jgi:hypothetical protein
MKFRKQQAARSSVQHSSSILRTIQGDRNRLLLSSSLSSTTWDEDGENAAATAAAATDSPTNNKKPMTTTTTTNKSNDDRFGLVTTMEALQEKLRVVAATNEELVDALSSSQVQVNKLTKAKTHLIDKIRNVWSKLPKEKGDDGDNEEKENVDDENKAAVSLLSLPEQLRMATTTNETLRAALAASRAKIGQLTKDKTRLIDKIRTVWAHMPQKNEAATKAEDDDDAALLLRTLQLEHDQLAAKYYSLKKKIETSTSTTTNGAATTAPRQLQDQVRQLQTQLRAVQHTQILERQLLSLYRTLGHHHGFKHHMGSAIRQAETALTVDHMKNHDNDKKETANAGGRRG